jgi:transcriptional regulator with XRE-family HTH domain
LGVCADAQRWRSAEDQVAFTLSAALSDLRQRVGRRIRELRQARLLSRDELGELVGLDKEAIGRIERGERMNFDNLEPIAHAVGVDVAVLFSLAEPLPPPYPLSQEALTVAYHVDLRQRRGEVSFYKRVLKILKHL